MRHVYDVRDVNGCETLQDALFSVKKQRSGETNWIPLIQIVELTPFKGA
jgi:hypothetical protein